MAENLLNLVPKGTHDSELFINSQEIESILENEGLQKVGYQSQMYNILTGEMDKENLLNVNYCMAFQKLD